MRRVFANTSVFLALLLLLLGQPQQSRADWTDWEEQDRYMFGAWATTVAMDTMQTLDIRNHANLRELNPLMPSRPTHKAVALHTGSSLLLGYWFVDQVIPPGYRTTVLGTMIGIELVIIQHNRSIGLHFAY